MVNSEAAQHIGNARAAHGCLISLVSCDGVVGQHATIAPAVNPEVCGVCQALSQEGVRDQPNVLSIRPTPLCPNGILIVETAP